jgi:hypothetical protein
MKLPLIMLFPLAFLMSQVQKPFKTDAAFSYELTVNALRVDAAPFNLAITGYILAQNGERTPFRMNRKNLITPYQFNLKNGYYTITVESRAKKGDIVSKVQGLKDGEKMGSASNDDRKTILEVGPGGKYAARGE